MPYSYAVTARSQADPDAVFAALTHAATWPVWSPIGSADVEDGDPTGRQEVGDTRIFRTGRHVARERIVELITDRRFVYDNVGGPFRSYRGTVDLTPVPAGGTDITWSAAFEPKLPLSGGFWRWYLTRFMQRMADGLAAYADGGTVDGGVE
ncbi:SRPBCC family protein [Nonomuraea dietziae]|uniref:SRPBCC family protein n=1 Tax=Nonomuraea dietziae TaxID=65515 RepID=UPI00342D8981